jgi:3',5'-cyclic-AMP phosphodiesterase
MMRDYIRSDFNPHQPDVAGVVSWVHIGDLHMDSANGQNYADLLGIVKKINVLFADSISFVFLPGDNADHGSAAEYELVRSALDELDVPWCAIVGDHDVHEKSFDHFLRYMSPLTHYAFEVGEILFIALNAFGIPDPGSFTLLSDELEWLEVQLAGLKDDVRAILFLHCYPSDLKQGGERLREFVAAPQVRLIDMGHTHYNEVSNDGKTLYTATRSTGQIEEGPVGFSVTNMDGDTVSWKFVPLEEESLVKITAPADERFLTESSEQGSLGGSLTIRAKAWGKAELKSMTATMDNQTINLAAVKGSRVWEGTFPLLLSNGSFALTVTGTAADGRTVQDRIRVRIGPASEPVNRSQRDQDNALEAWPERGLLGTLLGPNKNGKKW